MEFQELKVFLGIIEFGGFRNASKELGLTQSAVSQSLANLERKIGEKLINRSTPVSPTLVGNQLLHHARLIIDRENLFLDEIQRMKKGFLKTISIAVDHLAESTMAPEIVGRIHKIYPESKIKIHRLPSREIIEAIQSENYMIGIGSFQKKMTSLKKVKLKTNESILVTGKKNKKLKTYSKNPLHFLSQSTLLSTYIDDPIGRPSKKKIRDYFKDIWEVRDINLQIELLKNGIGATFIPRDMLTKELKVLEDLPFSTIKKDYGIFFHEDSNDLDMIQKIVSTIKT